MREIFIKYDTPFEEWKIAIKDGLEEHGIVYSDEMLSTICRSLNNTIIKYLTMSGYRPKPTLSYRKNFMNKLRYSGLTLVVKTNYVFWKYLEYFIDLTDYSKGFDISIEIDNYELASKDMIFVSVSTPNKKGIVNHPLHYSDYTDVCNKLDFVKGLIDKKADERLIKDMLKHITDILEYLIRSVD